MKKTKRLGLILTEKEKYWVIQIAELEGGLSQAALIRRLIRRKAVEHHLCLPGTQYLNQIVQAHVIEENNRKEKLS